MKRDRKSFYVPIFFTCSDDVLVFVVFHVVLNNFNVPIYKSLVNWIDTSRKQTKEEERRGEERTEGKIGEGEQTYKCSFSYKYRIPLRKL